MGAFLLKHAGRQDFEDARERRVRPGGRLLRRLARRQVSLELVEQVVDDVGREDADAQVVGQGRRLAGDRHVKREHARPLGHAPLPHDGRSHHVPLVDGPDGDACDRDGRLPATAGTRAAPPGNRKWRPARTRRRPSGRRRQKCRACPPWPPALRPSRSSPGPTTSSCVPATAVSRPCAQILMPCAALDRLVVLVGALDAQLFQGVRGEEGAHSRHQGPVQAARDDGVALPQRAVDQDDVDGGTQALDDLHLQHRRLGLVHEGQAVHHAGLGER